MRAAVMGILCGITLCGCATQKAEISNPAPPSMVGMPEKALLACAGEPVRRESTYDMDFLSYGGSKKGATKSFLGIISDRYCMATVLVRNGFVQSINYQDRDGTLLGKADQCADLFNNCTSGNRANQTASPDSKTQ